MKREEFRTGLERRPYELRTHAETPDLKQQTERPEGQPRDQARSVAHAFGSFREQVAGGPSEEVESGQRR